MLISQKSSLTILSKLSLLPLYYGFQQWLSVVACDYSQNIIIGF